MANKSRKNPSDSADESSAEDRPMTGAERIFQRQKEHTGEPSEADKVIQSIGKKADK